MATRRKKKKTVKRKVTRRGAKRKTAKRKTAKRKTAKRKTAKRTKAKKKRKANPSFMKPVRPDGALAAVVGSTPMPRTELTKKLWAYIKRNRLQDSRNKRMINADAKLRPVFNGKSKVSMFEMTKLVNTHVR